MQNTVAKKRRNNLSKKRKLKKSFKYFICFSTTFCLTLIYLLVLNYKNQMIIEIQQTERMIAEIEQENQVLKNDIAKLSSKNNIIKEAMENGMSLNLDNIYVLKEEGND